MRRSITRLALAGILGTSFSLPVAHAAFFGFPKNVKSVATQIVVREPALAPMAHTIFCLRYPDECRVRRMAFRGGAAVLTEDKWKELVSVNRQVNRTITPERNQEGLQGERWIVSPKAGDCNDYAVTKRHELLKRGWPSRSLLLAEVVVPSGEHHLVLVVRTKHGDLVLDNLAATIRHWSDARYQWVRVQSPRNPKYWSAAGSASV